MSTDSAVQYESLRQQIAGSMKTVSAHRARLRRESIRYSVLNIISGALATFVAGLAALLGLPAGGSWRATCAVAAVFSLGATVIAGLQMHLADPDYLAKVSECLSRLRALKVETDVTQYDVEAVRKRYQQILLDFPDIDF